MATCRCHAPASHLPYPSRRQGGSLGFAEPLYDLIYAAYMSFVCLRVCCQGKAGHFEENSQNDQPPSGSRPGHIEVILAAYKVILGFGETPYCRLRGTRPTQEEVPDADLRPKPELVDLAPGLTCRQRRQAQLTPTATAFWA